MTQPTVVLSGAVEGDLDEAVLRRLIDDSGGNCGGVYGKRGKHHLVQRIPGFNHAARREPWLVLVDLDQDAECAPTYLAALRLHPAPGMCLRVAVRSVEAWLLADRHAVADLLGVRLSQVPANPDELPNPKRAVIDLARRSRRRQVREEIVPRDGSGRTVGPLYNSNLMDFVQSSWRPDVAAATSDSLRRCRERLHQLVERAFQEWT